MLIIPFWGFDMSISMKKIILLLFPLLFAASLRTEAQQSNPQGIFRKANKQYKQGHIRKALSTYHQLVQQNRTSGALFMNMGLSYIRLDSLGKAEYYFLKPRILRERRARQNKP